MDSAPGIGSTLQEWLRHFDAVSPAPTIGRLQEISAPVAPSLTIPALAALAAEALARNRSLWIVTANDALLPDLSNALDLHLRPLCLVLPGADYAGRIALRATFSLLKSRLARNADDSVGPAWAALRARLRDDDSLWRACQAWSTRGIDSEAPPQGFASLFPVRIGPASLAERLAAPVDWVMLVQSGQLPASARTAWSGASCTLMLSATAITGATGLAVIDATARLRAELEVLVQELAEMELELATAQGELAGFSERYHALIAGRLAELDRIQADLANLRMQQSPEDPAAAAAARQAEARAEQSRRESAGQREEAESAKPFRPSNDLKKRFRQLAQKIHPDRARDEDDRAWRTQLMSEANRAYRNGDAAALDEVLALWLEGRQGDLPAAMGAVSSAPNISGVSGEEALAAQVTRVRLRIAAIAAELDRLYGSKLYELFSAARIAARQGRDLLDEMAARIDDQIATAQAALDNLLPSVA